MTTTAMLLTGTIKGAVGAGTPVDLGNAALDLSIEEDTKELADYQNPGGGSIASLSRIKSVTLKLKLWSISKENLALATRGTVSGNSIEALTQTAEDWHITFDGVNEVNGDAVTYDFYKVKFSPASSLPGPGTEDFAVLELTGKVLKDTSKTGAGVSQYFKATITPAV
ncbi:hypothetical protein [Methylococcus capsulatus]|jgi:hypothetical protein|uniref:Uncharacterized protein n=1 Tax=Methylococcus capsulatus TaxID=414 RepID=A0AA35Y0W4_METCP|nr:hypothetical protein [Methylococcus capsulatus]QXP89559.1 hypothetical protein KW114_10630 [Methylococcus capsulatus]CAI8818786.1 conserved protein of unknown function [Methylococcus capsulatus]